MNSKFTFRKNAIIAFGAMIVNPILALPIIIVEALNNKKYSYFLLSLFMAMLAYVLVPLDTDDLTRHYETYEQIKDFDFNQFLVFLAMQPDYALTIFISFLVKVGLSKQFIPFTAVFISYWLKLLIVYKVFNYGEVNKRYQNLFYWFLVIFFVSTTFRGLALNIRNYTALTILTYGTFLITFKENKKGWWLLFIAIIIHFSIAIFIPLLFISEKIKTRYLNFALYVSFIFFLIPTQAVVNVIDLFNFSALPGQTERILSYTQGYYMADYAKDRSFNGIVSDYIGQIPYWFVIFYLILTKSKSRLRNFVVLSVILTNVVSSTPMLYGRYFNVTVSIFILLLLYDLIYNGSQFKVYFMKIFAVILIICFLTRAYATREQLIKSAPQLFLNSSYSIFSVDVKPSDYIVKKK